MQRSVAHWTAMTVSSLAMIVFVGLAADGDGQTAPGPRPNWIPYPGKALSITSTEITVDQFKACVDAGQCLEIHFSACNSDAPGREDHPMNCVDYFGAEQYCGFVGGRLCSEDEWLEACRGAESRAFPYGPAFEVETCNYQSLENRIEGRPLETVAVASDPRCQGGFDGLYDMAGNVAEWVNACKDTYCKFRGGAYLTNDPIDLFTACGGVCAGNQKTFNSGTVGIRCCRDDGPAQ